MGRRRSKRRPGVKEHPGVSLLRPTASRPYWRISWKDADGKVHRRSTGTADEQQSRTKAVEMSQRLGLLDADEIDVSWVRFCQRYEEEHLARKARKTLLAWKTAAAWYTRLMNPQFLDEVTSSSVSRFASRLRPELESASGKVAETTISSYLKQLRAGFNWAHRHGLLARRPVIEAGDTDVMRSRPVTEEEFHAILDAVEEVRPRDTQQWTRFLWGLWESGFRISELAGLSWNPKAQVCVDLRQKYPMVRFAARGHKRGRQQLQPITPAFWGLIRHTPDKLRRGLVFPLYVRKRRQASASWIGKVISKIAEKAGVDTGLDAPKWASSHDIGKRALTNRLAEMMSEMDVAKWQRHEDSKTTRKHYHYREAEELAKRLWGDELPD
jgi:integrase